jgi:hypothetical protein
MKDEAGAVQGRAGSPGGPRAGASSRRARARQKAAHTVTLDDVRRYRHHGVVAESMKPLAQMAQVELEAWIQDLGGPDSVSAQRRAVLEDCARMGVILRAQLLRFMRSDGEDRHAATSATTAAAARRASLQAVGLERRAKPITVDGVVADIEARKD